jgi:adenylate kinase
MSSKTQSCVPLCEQNDRAAWLKGPDSTCSIVPLEPLRARRIVLLGAPGSGKGTQGQLLAQRIAACHLSTGDIFRSAKSTGEHERTDAMNAALNYMQHGDLVPDQTVLDLVRERAGCLCCHGGFILDGFPRTVAQAEALERLLQSKQIQLDAVIEYHLPIDQIVARLSGRRTCTCCKAIFHIESNPPAVQGLCDRCGAALVQREDDRPQSIQVRQDTYARSTAPLMDFYHSRGLLIRIDATGTPQEILSRTLAPFSVGLQRAGT